MNEEQNNEQQEVQDSKLKQAAGRAGKQVVNEAKREAGRQVKKVLAEAFSKAIQAIVAWISAHLLIVLAILAAVILIIAIDDFLDGESAKTFDEVTNNAMGEYCTIDEYGVHFDKDKFVSILPLKLKEEIGIDFNDLGLGTIMVDPLGYVFLNPDSQAAEYLYKYMAASLSSELPYIEGSDEETKGIIKIKRTLNSTEYSDSTLQPPDEPTDTPVTKTIDTSSYGLTPENVKITMNDIKNEYKIAWVSDLHMMHPDQPTINTKWYSDHGMTFEQRNNIFNNSYLILEKIINCLKGNDFDAIVFGGDIMDNYSDKNLEYLKRKIDTISDKKIMFLVADHDYLTEMTTNSGENTSASSIGESGDIKKITIGKDGDSINLVGQNYSNKQISDANVSTINSYINETPNSLFFTHVPVESKTQASEMQAWSKSVHNGQVYYWSKEASSEGYKNPSESYLNTLYSSGSLRGVFAGHVHSTGDFELNTGIKEHIFRASFNNSIGVITLTPSGSGQTTPVEVIEDSNNTQEIELKYIGYNQLQDMINSDDVEVKKQSLRYFSLDSSWNLCITKWRSSSTNGVETSFEVSEVKIPYRKMISQYTIPFTFLMDLQLISQNANYVEAVSKLMTDRSFIDFTIFDSVTTDETTYTYEATINTKTKHMEFNPTTMVSYETGYYDKSTEQEGPEITVNKVETDTIKASVTKAKTWIIDQTITYNLQESREYPYGAEPGKVEESSEPEPEGEGTWRDPIKETWYEEIIKREWVKGAVETEFMPDEFLGLWSNKTGTYVEGASYLPATEASGGKLVEYDLLDGDLKEKPVTNIIISQDQLYDLLAETQTTQTHSEMMKEIINFYLTGEELTKGLTFDLNEIYAPKEFNDTNWSDLGTGFWWPLDEIYTTITSKFGYRGDIGITGASTYHKWIDIAVPQGKNVYAVADGIVEVSTNSTTAGLMVKINHQNGVKTVYMHNSKLLVKVGQKVKQGDVIAYSGNTGVSGGPHLHFGVEVNGNYVDPLTYVDPNNSRPSGSIGGGTQPDVPTNVEAWRPYIEKAFKELGYVMTEEKVEAILRQINTESKGNQNIMQGIKDSNSGKPIKIGDGKCPWCPSPNGSSCKDTNIGHGLLQFIPTTFYGNMISGHQNIYNGYDQICTCITMLEKRPYPYTHYIGKGTGWG